MWLVVIMKIILGVEYDGSNVTLKSKYGASQSMVLSLHLAQLRGMTRLPLQRHAML